MSLEKNDAEHTTENFEERMQSMSNISTDASNLERLNRWACAIRMFKERPLLGYGPGTYAMVYAPFQHPDEMTIISTNFGTGGNAHSEYLGPLSESGLPGLIIFLTVIVLIFLTGFKVYNKLEEKYLRTLVLGMILALVTYFLHGFLNNYLDTDKAAVPIFGIAAIFVALDIKLKKGEEIT